MQVIKHIAHFKSLLLTRGGVLFLASCMFFLTPIQLVGARPLAYIGFENSRFVKGDSCCKWVYDNWNDLTFRMPIQKGSDPALQHTWLSNTIANEGNRSLGIWLKANSQEDERQRVEFQIANSLYFRPELEESIYYGFALYIHPGSAATLRKGVVITQAWQVHNTSSSKEAPFSIRFEDRSNYVWTVYTSRDVPGVDNRSTQGTKTPIFTSTEGLQKGVWHEFIIWFKPSVKGKGAVRVWHNGQLAVSKTSQQNFGYKPQASEPFMTNRLEYRFGAYRVTGPVYPGDAILMYDQAKLGKSYQDVDP